MADAQNPESHDDVEGPVMMERSQSITSEEPFHGNTETTVHSPTVTPQYYSVMEDECPDDVFIHPLSLPSRLGPEEGSTCEGAAVDPSVSRRSSDGTEANANPGCLDWPHEEKQLMTSSNQVNKEIECVLSTFEEVVRSDSSSGIKYIGQGQELLEDKFKIQESGQSTEEVEECNDDEVLKDPVLNEEVKSLEDTNLLDNIGLKHSNQNTERLQLPSQTEMEDNPSTVEVSLIQSPDNSQEEGIESKVEDVLDNELTGYDWVRRTGVEDDEEALSSEHRGLDEHEESAETLSESRIATGILQGENLLQRLQLLQQRQDADEICSQTPKLEEDVIVAPETIQGIQQEEQSDQQHQIGSPLMTVTAQFEDCCIHETEVVTDNNESDDRPFVNLKVTSPDEDVCKQLEQDMPESLSTLKQIVEIVHMTKECGLEDGFHVTDKKIDEEHICVEEKNYSNDADDEEEAKGRTYLPNVSPQAQEGDADNIDGTNTSKDENRIPFPPCHRFSAAETKMEKLFQESSHIKKDLQRAEGFFDLTENPDVLEIPFKTNIFLPSEDPSPRGDWHFSEQKMQKEISQELQRELVLVNLGKIPGGYSKGESRQMKDTKLLFEAFQQEKMEGPTRIRKPLASLPKNQVYPSVLERTRSLEMFSQKISPMIRTHSFRQVSTSEKEKHPETFRPLSPSIRDKTRLSPYPKHEKHTRMHKSMDSINMTCSTATGVRSSKQETTREGSPLLMENPFFKLRPALSLQPEVEKDIREAKKREEELRKQRSSLYGEMRPGSKDEGRYTADLKAVSTQKTTGRLERVWPPPSKKDPTKPEQQEAKVQRSPGQKAALWQRWESGLINGQSPATTNTNNN